MTDKIDIRDDVRSTDSRTVQRRPGHENDGPLIDLTVDGPDTSAHRSQAAPKISAPPVRDPSYYLG